MHTFEEAARLDPAQVGREAARLGAHTDLVAPGFVLNAAFEENFYLTNNLPEQLRAVFAPVNPRRVDEDALEVLAERAERLVRASYLLDDSVQLFYRALSNAGLLGAEVHVRRDGETRAEVAWATPPGQDVLVALKRLWAADWTFDAVLERLDTAGTIALEARPTLVFAGRSGRGDDDLARRLGWPRALVNERGTVGA